ncbi:MAG: VgrG-related protein [Chloroflexota bacterium]
MNIATLVSQIYIKRNGERVRSELMANLAEVIVEQHSLLPDSFSLRLFDAQIQLIDNSSFELMDQIEVGALASDGQPLPLIVGEVTALEPSFPSSGIAELVVQGFDLSHRLYREPKSRAFLNVKDSDLAAEIAKEANLMAEITPTEIIYEHIYQDNLSDLAFLQNRAWRIGYECFVDDETLYFRPPIVTGQTAVSLQWGQDNLSIQPRLTVNEQVKEVVVRGWDIDKQKTIVGRAADGALYPENGEAKNGMQWANHVGSGTKIITDQPVISQTEANLLATARMDEISGTFIEIDGAIFRRPDVRAGQKIELKGVGERFSGTYLVTQATHHYSQQDGLMTQFSVCGLRAGLLLNQLQPKREASNWRGVVPAVVTNNKDPRNWGRVKVSFPWMAEDAESCWARTAIAGTGFATIPAVGDEVLVAFEMGDFNRPFILGSLWNGQKGLPQTAVFQNDDDRSQIGSWASGTGHHITLTDKINQAKVEIATSAGHKLLLDDSGKKLEIKTKGGLKLTLDDNGRSITVNSSGNIKLQANGNLDLNANGSLNLNANGQVNVKGAMINLN